MRMVSDWVRMVEDEHSLGPSLMKQAVMRRVDITEHAKREGGGCGVLEL